MIGRLKNTLTDLVFPRMCLQCADWPGPSAEPLCSACAGRLRKEREEPACPRCARAVAPFEVSGGECGQCRRKPTRLAGTVRVGPYRGVFGTMVRAYKYHGRDQLEPLFAKWLVDLIRNASWLHRVQAVVYVPTRWTRRLGRPLYPPERLASIVAKQIQLPRVPILHRIRGGPRQIGLSYSDRAVNVHDAFAMRKGVTMRNARLLLIDDVKTTGATLEECAKVLRKGGAAEVYGAVVAKVGRAQPGDRPPTSI